MAIVANTHVRLGASKPKKDAIVATGAVTLGANELAIHVGSNVDVSNDLAIIAAFEKLYRFAKTNIGSATGVSTWSMPLWGSDNQIVTSGHAATTLTLYVDAAIVDTDKSHFLHRTYKRAVERLLEESK